STTRTTRSMRSWRRWARCASCWPERCRLAYHPRMDELRFRTATVADIPALVALVTAAYRGDASRQGWTTEADILDGQRIDPDVLRHDIERPGSRILLAERSGALLACAHVANEEGAGYFGMFAVRPDQQGGGTGSRLMAEAERVVAEDWQLPLVRMAVI